MYFFVFCVIVKLFCKFRDEFFINLRLRQKINNRPLALFSKNLRSAAGKVTHSAAYDSTFAPLQRYFFQKKMKKKNKKEGNLK